NTKYLANFLGLGVRATQKYLRELIDVGIFEKAQELDEKSAKYTQNFTIIFNSFEEEEKELNESNQSPKNSVKENESMENDGFVKGVEAQSMEKSQVKEGEKKPLNGLSSHIYNKEFFSNKKFLYRLKNFSNRTIFLNLAQSFKAKNSLLDLSCFDEREKIEIDKWFAYKKRLSKGQFNAMSKERQLKKIKGFKLANQNIIAIINQSIEQGWQGLFAFKANSNSPSKASVRQSEKDSLMAYFDSLEAAK
ncbi:hypothetical protein CUPS4049_08825, partial [Campylobacter upsaliensis]|uniref:hypothetical protein n=1 Tax=Campylobacter upsaliensis TaxID=28080 RepID=UPI002149EDC5